MNAGRVDESEALFGRLLVEQGLARAEHVEECLAEITRLAEEGLASLPRLGLLLARRGYLTASQYQPTVRVSDTGGAPAHGSSRPAASDASLPGHVREAARNPDHCIGKYVRVARLGSGGMADVWMAWDRELGRWAALKFLKADKPEEVSRFKREAQTAGKLSHPNIAAIYEVGEFQGRHFISMQYVDGMTLGAYPRDDVRLLVQMVRHAALGVHYAHQRGVVHRDLKPANLMVASTTTEAPSPSRGAVHVYVMDFGLAKSTDLQASVSLSGCVVGTPTYMSPEQARGEEAVDARADVYSLGATLYELLTNREPFSDSNVVGLLQKVLHEDPIPVRKIRPRVNEDLETIVMKCLEKDRQRRYGSAAELAEDLRRWLDGEAILAHPPSVFYRTRKVLAKRRGAAAFWAVFLTAAVAVTGYWVSIRREAAGWVREAEENARAGQYEEAKRLFDQAATRIAVDGTLYRLCGQKIAENRLISERKRREDEVFAPILRSLESLADDPEGWKAGVTLLDGGLTLFAESWDAWMRKGRYLQKLEEFDQALEAYQKAYQLNPLLKAEAALARGLKKEEQGDAAGALVEYSEALAADPRHADAYVARARVRRARGDAAGAAEDYRAALRVAPPAWPSRRGAEEELGRLTP